MIVIAIIFAIFAYKATDYGRKTGYFLAEFNHVGSIKTGSAVKVGGVPVGKVTELSNPRLSKPGSRWTLIVNLIFHWIRRLRLGAKVFGREFCRNCPEDGRKPSTK